MKKFSPISSLKTVFKKMTIKKVFEKIFGQLFMRYLKDNSNLQTPVSETAFSNN